MAALGATGFALVVWVTIGIVLAVSVYLAYSLAREAGWFSTE